MKRWQLLTQIVFLIAVQARQEDEDLSVMNREVSIGDVTNFDEFKKTIAEI